MFSSGHTQKYNTGNQLAQLQEKFNNNTIFMTTERNWFGLYGERLHIKPCPDNPDKNIIVAAADVWGRDKFAAAFNKRTGARVMMDNASLVQEMPLTWERRRSGVGCPLTLMQVEVAPMANGYAERIEHLIHMAHQYHVAGPERVRGSLSHPRSHHSLAM